MAQQEAEPFDELGFEEAEGEAEGFEEFEDEAEGFEDEGEGFRGGSRRFFEEEGEGL